MNEKDNDAFNEKRSEYLDGMNLPKEIAIKVKPPPPKYDYSKKESWAALPSGPVSYADLEPVDEPLLDNKDRPCDCFFVHPTGYFRGDHWNSPIPDEQADEQTLWMLGGSEPVGVTYWKGCFTLLLLVSELAVSRLRSRNREIIYDHSTLN